MVRTINSSTKTQVQSSQVNTFFMAKLELGSPNNIYVNSTSQKFVYDSQTYIGVGALGTISVLEEGVELADKPVTLELSGVDATMLSTALNVDYQNKAVTIYLAVVDDEDAFIGVPVVLFKGKIDTMSVSLSEDAKISVRCSWDWADWERPSAGRYTNEDQQARFTGDKGLEFISQSVEKQIFWGREE